MNINVVKEYTGAYLVAVFLLSAYGLWFWGQSGTSETKYLWGAVMSSEQSPSGGYRGYLAPFTSRIKIGESKMITAGSLQLLTANSSVCIEIIKSESGRELQYNAVEGSLCKSRSVK